MADKPTGRPTDGLSPFVRDTQTRIARETGHVLPEDDLVLVVLQAQEAAVERFRSTVEAMLVEQQAKMPALIRREASAIALEARRVAKEGANDEGKRVAAMLRQQWIQGF